MSSKNKVLSYTNVSKYFQSRETKHTGRRFSVCLQYTRHSCLTLYKYKYSHEKSKRKAISSRLI